MPSVSFRWRGSERFIADQIHRLAVFDVDPRPALAHARLLHHAAAGGVSHHGLGDPLGGFPARREKYGPNRPGSWEITASMTSRENREG